ncbi:MAG: hypothetical protein NTV30_09000, partial [Chloroflexi bacterium]|nr:hypothetical protein [Chloroflexota bacterium]
PLADGGYWRPKLFMGEASGYTNTIIEAKMAQRSTEMDDAKRLALDMEIQELFSADVPLICLHHSVLIHTYRTDKFTGWIAGTGAYTGGGISYGNSSISFGISTFNSLNLKPVTQ